MNIKRAKKSNVKRLGIIDSSSFPPQETTSKETILYRIHHFPQWFFVAEENEKIIGFISCRPCYGDMVKEELYSTTKVPESTTLAILHMAVEESSRGKGVGKRLMEHIITLADTRGIHKMILCCTKESMPYFQSFGFTKNGAGFSKNFTKRYNKIRKR